MPEPIKSDSELLAIARDLMAKGRLTVRNLHKESGGGDYKRLGAITRTVKEEVREMEAAMAAAGQDPSDVLNSHRDVALPQPLATALGQLARVAAAVLHQGRVEEGDRARAAEEALRSEHEAVMQALRRQITEVEVERDEMAEMATGRALEVERLQAEVHDVRDRVSDLRNQVTTLQQNVCAREDEMQRQRTEHRQDREHLEAKVENLVRRLDEANSRREEAALARQRAEAKIKQLEPALGQECNRREALEHQLNDVRSALIRAELERDRACAELVEVNAAIDAVPDAAEGTIVDTPTGVADSSAAPLEPIEDSGTAATVPNETGAKQRRNAKRGRSGST